MQTNDLNSIISVKQQYLKPLHYMQTNDLNLLNSVT